MRTTSAKWHEGAVARSRVLELFEKDAAKLRGDPRKILFSFLSDPAQALAVIREAHPWVSFWKVGKLNHMKEVESNVDWGRFRRDVEALLKRVKAHYYIKDDLRAFH